MTEVKVIENLPMFLNLGDWGTHDPGAVIGWASGFRDTETGASRIEIKLDRENSDILENLQTIADLKALGFAGIMRRPES